MNQEEGPDQNMTSWHLGLGLPVSVTVSNKFLLFINHPSVFFLNFYFDIINLHLHKEHYVY